MLQPDWRPNRQWSPCSALLPTGHRWPGCPLGQCYSKCVHGPAASPGSLLEMRSLGSSPRCTDQSLALTGLPAVLCTVAFECGGLLLGADTAVVYQQGQCGSNSTSGIPPSSCCTPPVGLSLPPTDPL